MRHRVDTFKIGRSGAHRRAMLANMVSSLFEHGRIETTIVKAKAAASFAERLITLGKKVRSIIVVLLLPVFATKKRSKRSLTRSLPSMPAVRAVIPVFSSWVNVAAMLLKPAS